MRKTLKLLATSLMTVNSAIVVVGCRPASLAEVWIITDGGDLFDKAFNQQVVEGGRDFINTFNQNHEAISKFPGFEYWKNHQVRLKWIISKDGDLSTLQNNYNIAGYAGAKTIICAGFHHLSALTPQVQTMYKKLGVRFILIDSLVPNPIDVAGLTYAAEESSYLAGLAGALWLVANHEKYAANGLKMSTFGGLPADVVVEEMAGYYWGVYYYNQFRTTDAHILDMINAIRAAIGKPKMSKADLASDAYKIAFDKLASSFTGGFESGTPGAKAITSTLINTNKNDIVFPVAGAQTTDLISAIANSSNNNRAKIIGVDVDQSLQYDYAKDYFITSALKGIRKSVDWMLWHSFNLQRDNTSGNISQDPNAEDYFNGEKHYTPLKGKEYTGISNNPAISAIYDMLVENQKTAYWGMANKVSQKVQQLAKDLASNPDPQKWEKAWQTDIDANNPKYRPDF